MKRCCLLFAALAVAADARAVGYFNMPTSPQQLLGVGFGPGYHAPMVLGRAHRVPIATQPVLRQRYAPTPPVDASFAGPSRVHCQPHGGFEAMAPTWTPAPWGANVAPGVTVSPAFAPPVVGPEVIPAGTRSPSRPLPARR